MMKKKLFLLFVFILFVLLFFLVVCSGGSSFLFFSNKEGGEIKIEGVKIDKLKDGGMIMYGIDGVLEGFFEYVLYGSVYDS